MGAEGEGENHWTLSLPIGKSCDQIFLNVSVCAPFSFTEVKFRLLVLLRWCCCYYYYYYFKKLNLKILRSFTREYIIHFGFFKWTVNTFCEVYANEAKFHFWWQVSKRSYSGVLFLDHDHYGQKIKINFQNRIFLLKKKGSLILPPSNSFLIVN